MQVIRVTVYIDGVWCEVTPFPLWEMDRAIKVLMWALSLDYTVEIELS